MSSLSAIKINGEREGPSTDEENRELVLSYLQRLSDATNLLAQAGGTMWHEVEGDDSRMIGVTGGETSSFYVDQIARHLLAACRPEILASGISNLPSLKKIVSGLEEDDFAVFNEDGDNEQEQDEDEGGEELQHWPVRRTDYLRQLLRVLAPISMDVAGQVCSIALSSSATAAANSNESLVLPTVLLLSHWLPVAPHLAALATDVLQSLKIRWNPTVFQSSLLVELLVAQSFLGLCTFFGRRGEIAMVQRIWDWTFVFGMMAQKDVVMKMEDDASMSESTLDASSTPSSSMLQRAVRWHAARIVACLLDWKPSLVALFLKRLDLESEQVPWKIHPWSLDREEASTQHLQMKGLSRLWDSEDLFLPSADEVRKVLPLHSWFVHLGMGLVSYKHGAIAQSLDNDGDNAGDNDGRSRSDNQLKHRSPQRLTATPTTCRNLALLGTALCQEPYPPPVLICGPHGSGKSSLIRELMRLCNPNGTLLEIHVDEETDSKTLIGSYNPTDIPGEFAWRAGALTQATRTGQWVLLEDVDAVPVEIQATLVKLLEDRLVPLGNGNYERCHPKFRLFGTCTTTVSRQASNNKDSLRIGRHRGGGKQILNPSLWRKVHVDPLPFSELKDVALALYPNIPESVSESALALLQALDVSGRTYSTKIDESSDDSGMGQPESALWIGGRPPSVRDFFKLLSRISQGICFEPNASYATETQRTLCLAESVDVFCGSCPERKMRHEFINRLAAPIWGISRDLALRYVETRQPTTLIGVDFIEVGRAKIEMVSSSEFARKPSETFAQTNHSLRLMEAIGVCIRENEPVLLVGETGCGKTTLVQQLAGYCDRELLVQNLSLQTDSTDLLGGYRPLELQHIARKVYGDFVDIFCATFSRKQNAQFLEYANSTRQKSNWKKLSQCFLKAAKLGLAKMKERSKEDEKADRSKGAPTIDSWRAFETSAERFERQRIACDSGLAFTFSEGALVDAIRQGKWVLLDEINLASSDTLQRLCGLLDDPSGSVTLTERGDSTAVERHPHFRLFAAMNPATDAGKKDLPASIRSRYSEIYVDELLDPVELRMVSSRYLAGVLTIGDKPPEHTEIVVSAVNTYLECRDLAEKVLADGGGHKPRYTLRTLSRALSAAKTFVVQQRLPLKRAIFEGFQLAFEGALDSPSVTIVRKVLKGLLGTEFQKHEIDHPGRRPGGRNEKENYVLVKPFWILAGPLDAVDWSEASPTERSRFILTPSMASSLRRLARAVAAGPWPILLEGPTSAGKTSLVEYIAARCGHQIVRINNHEHTDVQEYTGSFAADSNGSLSFRDGILVRALRRGHWVILDELNLAPSEVLEALNRLLDDNRELYLAETNETVKPHPNFRLFATQNPSGAYGGRKPLSRAFRNRFVEIHMGDIPSSEMTTILEQRCGCPPSHAKRLVEIMDTLRQRRSRSSVFLGKDSFITPRDLLRWAERHAGSKLELAHEGYMLLAERLRTTEEIDLVRETIEDHFKLKLKLDDVYYGSNSEARELVENFISNAEPHQDKLISTIAPTRSLLRLISLVLRCIRQKEPVLLVGDTGCGKTTVVQFLSLVCKQNLHTVNCHATTETSDLIGGLRPVRGRDLLARRILHKLKYLLLHWPYQELLTDIAVPEFVSLENLGDPPLLESDECEENGVSCEMDSNKVSEMLAFARAVFRARPATLPGGEDEVESRTKKRRKLDDDDSTGSNAFSSVAAVMTEIEDLARRYAALFEWADGPLVEAMKSGQMLLLDEMSLAEDAVLERLNSVLEPSRTLVLAEKGDDGSLDDPGKGPLIAAHSDFRIFATMNPGGDFGKRELSPALRSRFTEIWVPPVTDRSDMELVLSRTLASSIITFSSTENVIHPMLAYVEWFNQVVCGEPASPFTDLQLTLRDVLSWARFIVDARVANKSIGIWEAYIHGASLMHLDGLGLGAGLALEDAAVAKRRAEAFLSNQAAEAGHVSRFESAKKFFEVREGSFGAEPFFIPIGSLPVMESTFNLTAPTTFLNMFRVVRAMQVSKPVLLEGSPGVGKTSLIAALAEASGHKLVRINLSEQTDISDLMGNDLPVPEPGATGASFNWCDGVLLTAIKEGSWVLLDELNLASQSVLEGLNSCLDHRATVYIPELGRSFVCPPNFRVFAAQNPLAQGGGRKGLPKSFLNRFTKVYVDALDDSDLRVIVALKFPSLEKSFGNCLIDFNKRVHCEVVERREFGESGSPWEFNLRDVFRWCELLSSGFSDTSKCARDLYVQRFRTVRDRERLGAIYAEVFGSTISSNITERIDLDDTIVRVGDVSLQRRTDKECARRNPLPAGSSMCLSLLQPMEAAARCVEFKWPCLLVGGAGSGKTCVVSSLAELCNVTLVEQCLSPSSDVTELVGCYEQVDSTSVERGILEVLQTMASEFLLHFGHIGKSSMRVWELLNALPKQGEEDATSGSFQLAPGHSLFTVAVELSKILLSESQKDPNFNALCGESVAACASNLEEIAQRGKKSPKTRDAGHFQWRDGILVEAMIEGHWLHLEGVNLCPSSVLDRLNSVMEIDGHLLLSECGTQSGDGDSSGHRIIKPHPNFRVFLSMNPIHGEVSRAMRNRCVEIFLLQPIGEREPVSGPSSKLLSSMTTPAAAVDSLGVLWRGGIRSAETATALVNTYIAEHQKSNAQGGETPCIQGMHGSSRMLSTLLTLGISGKIAMQKFLQLSLEIDEPKAVKLLAGDYFSLHRSGAFSALPPCPDLRFEWSQNPTLARVGWDARLLRDFTDAGETQRMITLASAELVLFEDKFGDSALTMKLSTSGEGYPGLRNALLQIFLSKIRTTDLSSRCSFFHGLDSPCARAFSAMVTIMKKHLQMLTTSFDQNRMPKSSMKPTPDSAEWFIRSPALLLRLERLPQQLTEKEFYHRIMTKSAPSPPSIDLSVLEASICIHEGRMDRASISCALTPAISPLVLALDELSHQLLEDFSHGDFVQDCHLFYVFRGFVGDRDGLWRSLRNTSFLGHPGAFLGFDEAEFVVQWKWLKKSLLLLWSIYVEFASKLATTKKRRVDAMIENVDTVIFGTYGCPDSSNGVRKRMSIPLVPHRAIHWEAITELRRLATDFTIVMDARFHPFGSSNNTLELGELVDLHHPILFVQRAEKLELLTAISMVHWASTDELQGVKRAECLASGIVDAASSLRRSLDQKREAFGSKLSAIKVDSKIETVENLLGVEKLEELRFSPDANSSDTESYRKFISSLLESFGRIQLSALAEFWSCHEEARLVREICQIVVASGDPRRISSDITALLPSLKYFIDVVISKTFWTVADLRPFQTLVWAIDSAFVNGGSFEKLLRCLLPTMSATASRHMWSNSFVDLNAVTTRIDLPTFWSEDSDPWITSSTASSKTPVEAQKFGPARLKQRVRSDISFRIFGSQFIGSTLQRRAKLYTIENHEARRKQSQQLLNMFASLTIKNPKKSAPYEISYLFGDVLQALRSSFPDNTSAKLVELAKQPELLLDVNQEQIFELGKQSSHRVFLVCLDRLVMPLFDCMRCIWKNGPDANDFEEQVALAWIYVGLLRINFLAPDSPLDPGRAPLAKVSLVDRKLTEIRLNVFARRLDSGFTGGNFSPDSVDMHRFLDEGKNLVQKKISQEKKVVERADSAPPFFDLFRETKDFVKGPIGTDNVLNLVGVIRGARNETGKAKVAMQRELNWQRTVTAFCSRLQSFFASYEDITTPFVDAVQWVQRGVCILVDECTFKGGDTCATKAFDVLLQFPMGHFCEETEAISGALGRVEKRQDLDATDRSNCLISLALAALARLSVQKQQLGFDSGSLSSSVSILNGLAKSHLGKLADQPDQAETEEERLEREYREQFPDHHAEFTSLMRTADESADELDIVPNEESSRVTPSNTGLTEQDATLLCMLHRELFCEHASSLSDPARIRTFCLSYRAAYCLELLLRCSEQNTAGMERMAAHAMALSLASRMDGGNMAVNQDCDNADQGSFDFHTDPSPREASTAAKPIEGLTVRLTQLLTAFPGHSILLAIGKVCERVQKFDLLVTPMGKVMAGLEAILKSAQDWEQHASDRVRLGAPLRDMGQLVARWRKLELQSWSRLILAREKRHVKRARRHWMRLHAVLHSDIISMAPSPDDEKDRISFTQQCTPKWVWKGMSQESGRLSKYLCDSNMSELVELMKVLDSFILTSTLGEFKERLVLIESFSKQLLAEFLLQDRATNWPLKLSRVLLSLSSHYRQFLPFLSSKLDELRRPIETRLNEEVKLAKWDEQSYYSLADSTERNHRKLMKILAEYDAVLGMNVGLLLQQQSCSGIRTSVDAHDEMCSSMPPKASMFPFAISPDEQKKLPWEENASRAPLESRTWLDAMVIGAPIDSHICRMRKYAFKMASLQDKDSKKFKAFVFAATSEVSEFSDAVFERIESLRAKATRPMKERALVDLFRELKRQGFQSTKWSIPAELRSMAHLLLLPPPATDPNVLEQALCSQLEKAEEYFRRSLNELNNFRSEAAMLGSKSISQRQMNMMVHFSEHGLLMLAQQRSSISNLLVDVSAIHVHENTIKHNETTLPESQTRLFAAVTQFDRQIKCVDETIRQLTLLVKSSQPLLEEGTSLDWALGAITDLESHLSKAVESIAGNSASIVTWGQLEWVWKAQSWLNDAVVLIRRLQDENEAVRCVPFDAFEKCCDQLVTAQESASKCRDMAGAKESNTHGSDVAAFSKSLNAAVEYTLLAVQGFCGGNGLSSETSTDVIEDVTVTQGSDDNYSGANMWDSHKDVMRTWAKINLKRVNNALGDVLRELRMLHDENTVSKKRRDCCVGLVTDLNILSEQILKMSKALLRETVLLYRATAKLNYVLLRVFRVLVSKGFCSDVASDGGEGNAEGDTSGMTFEDDQDGTGMGEGEGKRDVTDQLESEEQLLGLKGDQDDSGQAEKPESRQLNEDEAETGMEMEADFDGEMCDLPEKPPEKEDDNHDDEEELDRGMGEDGSPDEEVVDEKMWNSDDEEEMDKGEEKFEQDSSMKGEAIEGATRTKDDEESKKKGDDTQEEHDDNDAKPKDDGGEGEKAEEDHEVNEDEEDRYEESHGVDVRGNEMEEKENAEDDMQLDDDVKLDHEDEGEGEGEEPVDEAAEDAMDEDNEDSPGVEPSKDEPDIEDDGMDENPPENSVQPSGIGAGTEDEEAKQDENPEDDKEEEAHVDVLNRDHSLQEAHGVKSRDGKDSIVDDGQEDEDNGGDAEGEVEGEDTGDSNNAQSGGGAGGSGYSEREGMVDESPDNKQNGEMSDAPNPFKNPGDATKFWHRKLNVVDSSTSAEESMGANEELDNEKEDKGGDYEFTSLDQKSSTQVLGEVAEEEAVQLESQNEDENSPENQPQDAKNRKDPAKTDDKKPRERASSRKPQIPDEKQEKEDVQKLDDESVTKDEEVDGQDDDASQHSSEEDVEMTDEEVSRRNMVVSDLSRLRVEDQGGSRQDYSDIISDEQTTGISSSEVAEARNRWLQIQGETHFLARRLCEKLRLVMEPLVASKLRGDYRSGKRINMKRVIGYIASGYRKDKIWLRRTKPAKRNYRVLVAVDDSESMVKSGAGDMALRAMATLAVGMNQLEIGELGVASFGNDMKILHPFHLPFTSESGANVVRNFQFDQRRTRTALCVASALAALDMPGDQASMQLVFLISDGRIERDSRLELKRLVREMMEKNILLAMIIVEGGKGGATKKDSIVNMKEVSFEKGKPIVKRFIEDYPFPYYVVLDDMMALPEVLGDALRQWFEMLTQLQGSS